MISEAETPILWPPDAKNWLTVKDPDAGKDWRLEKGTTEDEMVGWPHWLDEQESEQALGVGGGQGSLVCCSPWGHKESDTTERLNWTELILALPVRAYIVLVGGFLDVWLAPKSPVSLCHNLLDLYYSSHTSRLLLSLPSGMNVSSIRSRYIILQ